MINKSKRVLAWVMTLMMAVVFIPCFSFAGEGDVYSSDCSYNKKAKQFEGFAGTDDVKAVGKDTFEFTFKANKTTDAAFTVDSITEIKEVSCSGIKLAQIGVGTCPEIDDESGLNVGTHYTYYGNAFGFKKDQVYTFTVKLAEGLDINEERSKYYDFVYFWIEMKTPDITYDETASFWEYDPDMVYDGNKIDWDDIYNCCDVNISTEFDELHLGTCDMDWGPDGDWDEPEVTITPFNATKSFSVFKIAKKGSKKNGYYYCRGAKVSPDCIQIQATDVGAFKARVTGICKPGDYYLIYDADGPDEHVLWVSVPKHTHKIKAVDDRATIGAPGKGMYYECSNCGYAFTSKKATALAEPVERAGIDPASIIFKDGYVDKGEYIFLYTGKALKPAVVVKDTNGKELQEGVDFTVKYSNSKNATKFKADDTPKKYATAKITFKGNYKGTTTLKFLIIKGLL